MRHEHEDQYDKIAQAFEDEWRRHERLITVAIGLSGVAVGGFLVFAIAQALGWL